MSLYDLFGFTQEERQAFSTGRKPKRKKKQAAPQLSLFDIVEPVSGQSVPENTAAKADTASETKAPSEEELRERERRRAEEEAVRQERMKPRPFTGERLEHYGTAHWWVWTGRPATSPAWKKESPCSIRWSCRPPAAACRILYGTP